MVSEFYNLFKDPSFAAVWMIRIASIQFVITSLEYILIRDIFCKGGMLSWLVLREARIVYYPRLPRIIADRLFDYRGILTLHAIRGALALGLIISPADWILFAWVGLATIAITLAINFRTFFGDDGSDQLSLIVVCNATAYLFLRNFQGLEHVALLPLYFVCFQILLAYFASGLAKLFSQKWRSGSALPDIICHYSYGNPFLATRISWLRPIFVGLNYYTILFLISFPLVLLPNQELAFALVICAISFHLVVALVMGINGFVPAFLSAYPALFFVRIEIDKVLSGSGT